jgi:hypothetical protein
MSVFFCGPVSSISGTSERTTSLSPYGDATDPPLDYESDQTPGSQVSEFIRAKRRLELALDVLARRQLLNVTTHQSSDGVRIISLTLAGYDLGRRLNSWWWRSGLWFEAHRYHWVMLILGIVGGVIGGLLLQLAKFLATYVGHGGPTLRAP